MNPWHLIRNGRHLLHAPREAEQFSNGHRPRQGIANARRAAAGVMPASPRARGRRGR